MEEIRLYVLSCGSMWVERGFMTHFGTRQDRGKPYVSSSLQISSCLYLIDHPKAKIVVDLGFDPADYEDRVGFPLRGNDDGITFKQEKDENPKAQLQKVGVSLDDVEYVIISHLMLEHAGYLPVFGGKRAKILVQRRELEYAYANANRKSALEPFHSWMYNRRHFDLPDLDYMLLDGDYTLVDGVEILFTPGHTPGYQMVKVNLMNDGVIILSPCELESMYFGIGINAHSPGIPHAFTYSAGDELRNFRKVAASARKENGRIFFGHDQAQFDTLKKVPDYYE